MNSKHTPLSWIAAPAFLLAALALFPTSTFAAKVNSSPSSATITEGSGSQNFNITLDEPIIAPEETPAFVRLNISSDDARLTLSTSSIYFSSSAWMDTRSLTVSAANDSITNSDNSAVITISVVSNSEYYSGYTTTIPITIVDAGGPSGSVGSSAGFSGGGSVLFGCRDTRANNYDRFTEHRAALCKYGNGIANTSANSSMNAGGKASTSVSWKIGVSVNGIFATTSAASIASISRDLSIGMRDADVLILQKFLIAENKGAYARALAQALSIVSAQSTGYFGKFTRDALLEWQLSAGVNTTGVFDQASRDAIQ